MCIFFSFDVVQRADDMFRESFYEGWLTKLTRGEGSVGRQTKGQKQREMDKEREMEK